MRLKKKLEQDVNELESALDSANRGRAEADKNIKKFQQQMREHQQQVLYERPQTRYSSVYYRRITTVVRAVNCE